MKLRYCMQAVSFSLRRKNKFTGLERELDVLLFIARKESRQPGKARYTFDPAKAERALAEYGSEGRFYRVFRAGFERAEEQARQLGITWESQREETSQEAVYAQSPPVDSLNVSDESSATGLVAVTG